MAVNEKSPSGKFSRRQKAQRRHSANSATVSPIRAGCAKKPPIPPRPAIASGIGGGGPTRSSNRIATIAVSAAHVGSAANGAQVADLLRSPNDAGRATAFLVLGGHTFRLLAPIVTGYVVAATGSFDAAFAVTGALALVGLWRL